jgi:hypothetical protein
MLKPAKELRRVPRVRDLEYLLTFLRCVERGTYDSQSLRNAMIEERTKFEQEKMRALKKGRTFDKMELLQRGKGRDLANSSQQLALQLGLVKQDGHRKLSLSEDGRLTLEEGLENESRKQQLITNLLQTYSPFREVLQAIRNNNGAIVLPMERGKKIFQKAASKYGITCTQWDYEMVRDLTAQLELINWKREIHGDERKHKVYLICEIATLSDLRRMIPRKIMSFRDRCAKRFAAELRLRSRSLPEDILSCAISKGYLVVSQLKDPMFVKKIGVDEREFDETLWSEYLAITEQRAMRPVFFSELRERVCERLLISNVQFDRVIGRMISIRDRYRSKVYAGGGAVPRLPGVGMLRRDLPLKTGADEYITYVKLDRVK